MIQYIQQDLEAPASLWRIMRNTAIALSATILGCALGLLMVL